MPEVSTTNNETEPTIGARVRAARERRGMTQAELGAACGVTEATVSRWESGGIEMLWRNVVAVAKALGIRIGKLVAGAQ